MAYAPKAYSLVLITQGVNLWSEQFGITHKVNINSEQEKQPITNPNKNLK